MECQERRSGLGRLHVNGAGVAVEQPVERAVAKSGSQDAPQPNEQEQDFDLHRRKEINDDDARTEDGTERTFPSSNVLHLLQIPRVSHLMDCFKCVARP